MLRALNENKREERGVENDSFWRGCSAIDVIVLLQDLGVGAEKLDDGGKLLADDLNVIGAFVTFNSAIAAERCIGDFKSLNKKRKQLLYRLGCKKLPSELLYGENQKVLKVVRAPPPEDVIWESMRFEMFPK